MSDMSLETFFPVFLLKFGQYQHLQQLLDGTLYLSSIQELRKNKTAAEAEEFRYDLVEGARDYRCVGPGNATLTSVLGKNKKPIEFPFLHFTTYTSHEIVLGNLCSFYGITNKSFQDNVLVPVDNRLTEFGSHFMVIKNFDEFIKRIDKAMEKTLRLRWYYGFINYFNEEDFNGKLNLYQKRSRYSYQREFRIYVDSRYKTSMKLEIGKITDIAFIMSSDLLQHFHVTVDFERMMANIRWPIES